MKEPVDYVDFLVALYTFETTGDVGPLVDALDSGRPLTGTISKMLAKVLRVRLLLPRPAGAKVKHYRELDAAIAKAYAGELVKRARKPDRSDDAAKAVCKMEPFCRLNIKPPYVRRAVTNSNAKARAQKSI